MAKGLKKKQASAGDFRYTLRDVLKEERLGGVQRGASNLLAGRNWNGQVRAKGSYGG